MMQKSKQDYRRAYLQAKSLEGMSHAWSVTTYVFFFVQLGYPVWMVLVANMAFMLVTTLFDPYTGRLGDKYGQRVVYVLGLVFWGCGMGVYGLSTALPGFILAEVIAAVGRALTSEALESWLENSIADSADIRAGGEKWLRLCSIPAGVLGGLLGSTFGFQFPWIVGMLSSWTAALITALLLKNFPMPSYRQQTEVTVPSISESLVETRQNPNLRYAVIFMLVTAFAFQPLNMYWTEVLRQVSGSDWWQGLNWIAIAVGAALGAHVSRGIRDADWPHFNLILISTGVCTFAAAVTANVGLLWPTLILFFLHEIPRGAIRQVLFTYSNTHIRAENRSTMNSIRSAALPLGSFLGLGFFTIFGFVFPNPISAWYCSGLVMLLFATATWVSKR